MTPIKKPATANPKNMKTAPAIKKLCLIIDDHNESRVLAETLIKRLGLATVATENGKKGLELCNIKIPDIILVDWYMPEMDGVAFISEFQKLKAQSKSPPKKTTIFMYSGENQKDKITKALMSGADSYILKPLELDTIRRKFTDMGLL